MNTNNAEVNQYKSAKHLALKIKLNSRSAKRILLKKNCRKLKFYVCIKNKEKRHTGMR